ncbi:hypothetical protein EYF80_045290 [Liparis tanakae]|uniref:Uncharacterized protein n=1 Tax=Liparis tanakae TaxID=230148 RepID=A0A4Z2FV15_9TELE|nr:hypothetical protein EYF80_045290 [Liparis tanakae]
MFLIQILIEVDVTRRRTKHVCLLVCVPTCWTPWRALLGLDLVVAAARCGGPGGAPPLGGPSEPGPSLKSRSSWNSTSLASPRAAWVGGSRPATSRGAGHGLHQLGAPVVHPVDHRLQLVRVPLGLVSDQGGVEHIWNGEEARERRGRDARKEVHWNATTGRGKRRRVRVCIWNPWRTLGELKKRTMATLGKKGTFK